MGQRPSATGPQFWSSAVIASALACCDLPVLLEEVRKARGWTQAELAGVIGYSQSWVSKVLRGRQALTLEQAREIALRAGIPVHLLRLGDPGGEDPAKRRDFSKAVVLAVVPWPKLPHPDAGTAPALTAITAAHRRLDANTPARELARGAVAHVEMAHRMLGHGPGPDAGVAAFAQSLAAAQPAPKQRAVIMLEVAAAARQEGTTAKDVARIDEAFGLACQALASGQQYGSERVIERSRQFRRAYTGPVTGQVREFDRHLQAILS